MVFTGLVLLGSWVGNEFVSEGPVSFWYGRRFLNIPIHYILSLVLILALAPLVVATSRRTSVAMRARSAGLWWWVLAGWASIGFSVLHGIGTGAQELFADWRNFVIIAGITMVATPWLASQRWKEWILLDLAIGYGMVAIVPLITWLLGGGDDLLGVRIPLFFGPALFMAIFASTVTAFAWTGGLRVSGSLQGALTRISFATSSLLVLLSFRRSFWLGWVVAMLVVVFVHVRRRSLSRSNLAIIIGGMAVFMTVAVLAIGGEAITERLGSFLPGSDSRYAVTNEDHFNDLRDAWSVVSENPVMGLGIGRYYETRLIAEWKPTSFEVHNSLLQVWLKFGIAGLLTYLGFHYAWIRGMWKGNPRPGSIAAGLLTATAIYLIAQFLASMVGTWPYGSFQLSVHHASLLAGYLALWDSDKTSPLPKMGARLAKSLPAVAVSRRPLTVPSEYQR